MPKISVIMPVYNGEKYLNQCLDSVIGQSLQDIEIICVNDGSTDSSPDILRSYAAKDPRVKVFDQPNLNAGAARNLGMKYATGEYYSFLDADDFFDPQMLELAYGRAEETRAEVVLFESDSYLQENDMYEAGKNIRLECMPAGKEVFSGGEIQNIFSSIVGWPWDKLFRADYIRELGISFQEQRTTNDLLFVFASVAKASRITILNKSLAHHRRTGKDSLSVTRERSWYCFYDALLALRSQLIKWGCFEQFKRDFINYCVVFSCWQLDHLAQPVNDVLTYMLGKAWFEQLGVVDVKAEDFYNPDYYDRYQEIVEASKRIYSPDGGYVAGYDRLAEEYEQLKRSNSYRIGRGITWLPRKVKGGVACIRQHGLRYTWVLGLRKIQKLLRRG